MTAADDQPRADRPAGRTLPAQGVAAALVAGLLLVVALLGPVPLAAVILVGQLVLALALLAVLESPGGRPVLLVGAAAAAAGDVLVLLDGGGSGGLAGVVALAFVAALVVQLARSGRMRVTESLAHTMLVVVLATSAACLVALRARSGGDEAAAVALAAAGAALLCGRVTDRLVPRPGLGPASTRGWAGLLVALGTGTLAGLVVAGTHGRMSGTPGALLGLAGAAAAAFGDLAVDLAAADLRASGRPDRPVRPRRVAAVRPVRVLLPFAVLGPVALATGAAVLR